MPLVIEFLDIQQYQIRQSQHFFYVFVPDASVGINADMDTRLFQHLQQRNQLPGLKGRLSATERDSSFLAEKRLLADGHPENLFRCCLLALSFGIDGIGVGAVQATEIAALQKDNQADTRSVVSAQ